MPQILKIKTVGYVGPGTGFQYLPPGEHAVGDKLDIGKRIIPAELAAYIVEIGKAVVIEVKPDEPDETETPSPDPVPLTDLTYDELQDLARQAEVPGRSKLNKEQLRAALTATVTPSQTDEPED
jgi:hypothetical protein